MKALVVAEEKSSVDLVLYDVADFNLPSRLVAPKKSLPKIRECYAHIYRWHLEHGMDCVGGVGNEELASGYLALFATLKSEEEATVRDIFTVARSVLIGALEWSASEVSNNRNLAYWANEIEKLAIKYGARHVNDFRKATGNGKATFSQAAHDYLLEHSPRLAMVYKLGLEEKNIGGLTVLKETNAHYNRELIFNPYVFGFREISERYENSLVNLAISGRLEILEVILCENYQIKVKVKNHTDEPIHFNIPQGQIFENEIYKCRYQNLATEKVYGGHVAANGIRTCHLQGYCINPFYYLPNDGNGKITVYRMDGLEGLKFEMKEMWKAMIQEAKDYTSSSRRLNHLFSWNSSWHQVNKTKQKLFLGVVGLAGILMGGGYLLSTM